MKTYQLPILYSKTINDKVKHWTISVEQLPNAQSPEIVTRYWTDNDTKKFHSKIISSGKNIGKKNETTSWEQACLEAQSKWNKKIDEGYVENLDHVDYNIFLPMLAHKFQERKHNIIYPAFTQPKIDGIRCFIRKISKNKITYYSRKGKNFTTLTHLTPELLKLMKIGDNFDGEIYTQSLSFQEIVAATKKSYSYSSDLQLWIFDCIDSSSSTSLNLSFINRFNILKKRFSKYTPKDDKIILTPTDIVNSESEIYLKHDQYVQQGFEGIIIRNQNGLYLTNHRSADLQKYKKFIDKEFKIIGGYSGVGNEKDCVIFTCESSHGTFNVRPRGSFELRQQWLKDLDNIIGRKLTVRYQNLTDFGIPRFPVGISIRDYE